MPFKGCSILGDTHTCTIISSSFSTVQFYIVLNVAVGGTNGFFPDGIVSNKPWANTSPQAFLDFWNAVSDNLCNSLSFIFLTFLLLMTPYDSNSCKIGVL